MYLEIEINWKLNKFSICLYLCKTLFKGTCNTMSPKTLIILKPDWPCPRDYLHTHTNIHLWQTDITLGLVMTTLYSKLRVIAFCCTRQAEPLMSTTTRQTLDLWPWPRPLTFTSKQYKRQITVMSKHDFEHLTLTFDLQSQPSLGQGQPSCQKLRSNSSNRGARTDTQMEGRYQVHYLPRFAFDNNYVYKKIWGTTSWQRVHRW